ncbi:MAG: aminoacyl-tRNA hydrolase [Clostridia bacterium]|nr:aminoacyl-tRNA hydrolase [Clostridia bacterium]
MKLIVGLGNPGAEFNNTPHNVGFEAIDKLADFYGVQIKKKRKNGLMAEVTTPEGVDFILLKPLTFMNNSGDCVYAITKKYSIKPVDVCVVLDDVDLTAGLARARPSGSAGTHNGLRSVTARLGTTDFARIRIGVDSPSRGSDLAEYVLRKMDPKTRANVEISIDKAVEYAKTFINSGAVADTK